MTVLWLGTPGRALGDSGPTESGPAESWSASEVKIVLEIHPDSTRFELEREWIDPESFAAVWSDPGTGERRGLERGVDFLLDPRRGTFRLLKPFPASTRIEVSFRAFPLSFPRLFRLHEAWTPADSAGGRFFRDEEDGAADPRRGSDNQARLQIAGSKTFSVEVGSQRDLSLRQSLDLSVFGRIGRDVSVRAVLTDRDTPLQPEGTSTELQDLDRVLVEVEGPRARMRLGDFELRLPESRFADYYRQLAGVEGEVSAGGLRVRAAGASSPGEFASLEFEGREGVQGPYVLSRDNTGISQPLVAGSEAVWLDGRRMTRGESEDYIIDYGDGSITFTSRHPITSYSRIAVDYQVADQPFGSRIYRAGVSTEGWGQAEASASPDDATSRGFAVEWLTEGDDADDPLGLDLTDEERRALAAVGDQADTLAAGIRFVGEGAGEYEQVFVDTLFNPFFVYRGPGGGDFLVRFEEVDVGDGDYVESTRVDTVFYTFVGEGEGDFLPARDLVAPQSHSILSLQGESSWGRALTLEGEFGLSDQDRNTLSSRDDGDNVGTAVEVRATSRLTGKGEDGLTFRLDFRNVDDRFRALGRLEPSFFALDWNLDPERLTQGDRRVVAGAAWRQGVHRVSAEVGRLENTVDFEARRAVVEGETRRGALRLSGRLLRTNSEDQLLPGRDGQGRRENDRARVEWLGSWVGSRIGYAGERSERGQGASRAGTFYREVGGRLETGSRFRLWKVGTEWTRRRTHQVVGNAETLFDEGRTYAGDVQWRAGPGKTVEASYTRREVETDLSSQDPGETVSEIGRVRWIFRDGGGAWSQEGRWELSTQEESERVRVLEFVGEGQGHYDSLGVYQGVGDYEIFSRQQGDAVRRNRIDASFRTELDQTRRGGESEDESDEATLWKQLWQSSRVVHYWTVSVESGRTASYLWGRMLPVLVGAKRLPRVDVLQRADWTAFGDARWFSPRLGWSLRRVENSPASGFSERTSTRSWTLRVRSRPASGWSHELEGELERDRRTSSSSIGAGESQTGWDTRGLVSEQKFRLQKNLSAEFELRYRRRARVQSPERADVVVGTPSLIWSPRSHSRIEVRTARTSLRRRGGSGRASRELEKPGWNSRILATVRLREALDLSFFVRESRPDGGKAVTDSRLELKATF